MMTLAQVQGNAWNLELSWTIAQCKILLKFLYILRFYPVPDTPAHWVLFSIDFFVCLYVSLFVCFFLCLFLC